MPGLARKLVFVVLLATPAGLAAQTLPAESGGARAWASPIAGAEPIRKSGDSYHVTAAAFTSPSPTTLAPGEATTASPPADASRNVSLSRSSKSDLPRLSPPGRPTDRSGSAGGRSGLLPSLVTVGSSLAVVLGLFFLFAWGMRRTVPAGTSLLPGDVVEVLGRSPLTPRQQLHLLRCGKKLLLVNVGAEGVKTLTEITEADEVDRLLGLCRQSHPQSASAAFRQIFQQFAGERSHSRPLDSAADEPLPFAGGDFGRSHRRLEDRDA